MQLSEIFSTPFLLSITIIIILFGCTFAYFSYKMTDQDHKINSMMGLVTSMAEETQYFRNKINTIQSQMPSNTGTSDTSNVGGTKHIELIAVSDDEDDSDEDSEVSEDEDEDDVSEDEEEDDDDDEEDDDDELSETVSISDDVSISFEETNNDDLDNKDIKIINIPLDVITHNISDIDAEELNHDISLVEDNTFLKTNVNLNGDLEIIGDSHKPDYKKLTINKLKEIVVSKGITNDVSKLKKNDLLKLLEDE